jgi:hypothetical protein
MRAVVDVYQASERLKGPMVFLLHNGRAFFMVKLSGVGMGSFP